MKKLTQKKLKELLCYNPETGVFTWRVGRAKVKKGAVAGSINSCGYLNLVISYKIYLGHRLAWLYVYGYSPENNLDHINRVKDDNRICNLREVSVQCNLRNRSVNKNNTSGVTGVRYVKAQTLNPWRSYIYLNTKCIHLGSFRSKLEAAKARWYAEVEHGFPNCNTTSSAYQYIKRRQYEQRQDIDRN